MPASPFGLGLQGAMGAERQRRMQEQLVGIQLKNLGLKQSRLSFDQNRAIRDAAEQNRQQRMRDTYLGSVPPDQQGPQTRYEESFVPV